MSRTGRHVCSKLASAVLAVSGLLCPANAASVPYADLLNGPATASALYQASANLKDCPDRECLALHNIADAFRAAFDRDHPNTMVHLKPPTGNPSRVADDRFRVLLLQHPDRSPDYCLVLTKLARHYSDWPTGLVTIELANRIDRGAEMCTQAVLAAFPSGEETDRLILAARESCSAARRPGCGLDVRPRKAS